MSGYLQPGGSGSLAIGSPVIGADPNIILYTDAGGNLSQSPDFVFDEVGRSFIVGAVGMDISTVFLGDQTFYNSAGDDALIISSGSGGLLVNPSGLTNINFQIYGSASEILMFAYPFGNTVNFGSASDLGGTVGIETTDVLAPSLIVKGIALQTAPLTQWQTSAAAQVAAMTTTGLTLGTATGVELRGAAGAYIMQALTGSSEDLRIDLSNANEIRFETSTSVSVIRLVSMGIEIDGTLDHDGTTVGFYGVAPVVRSATYTPSNVTTDRTFDANATSLDEVADVLGTLINDLKLTGIIG